MEFVAGGRGGEAADHGAQRRRPTASRAASDDLVTVTAEVDQVVLASLRNGCVEYAKHCGEWPNCADTHRDHVG